MKLEYEIPDLIPDARVQKMINNLINIFNEAASISVLSSGFMKRKLLINIDEKILGQTVDNNDVLHLGVLIGQTLYMS